jgi:hypothetical protein
MHGGMMRSGLTLAGLLLVAMSVGCAGNGSWATGMTRSEVFWGNLGITGNENNYTLETGSAVEKLSIIGNNNRVTVQWGVKLGKVEIRGQNNTIALPRYLIVRKSVWGNNNQFIETPREQYMPTREYRYAPSAPVDPGMAPQQPIQYYPPPGGEMTPM